MARLGGWLGLAGLGWAGLGCDWAGLAVGWLGWAGLGWATLKRKFVYSQTKQKLVYSKMERCVSTEKMGFRTANSNKQFLFISFLRV